MNREEFEDALEEFKEDNSEVIVLQTVKDFLVQEMDYFPTGEDDANEHKLNMLIRNLEEDLDRIESEKLRDWDPEQQ